MTNQELIARLLDWQEHDEGKINDTRQAAADHIKELESKLAEYKMVASAIDGQWAAGLDEIEELKARLKKATRLMELSVELATWNTTLLEDVIDFITEQKEQSND